MNNIELRLMVERNRREEMHLTNKHVLGKHAKRKTMIDVMNNFPSIMAKEVCFKKLNSK